MQLAWVQNFNGNACLMANEDGKMCLICDALKRVYFYLSPPTYTRMISEMPAGIPSGLLAQIRASNTRISCRITTVRVERPRSTMLEIIPRDVGTDSEGWSIGKEEIPVKTLEEGIIVAMEMQARE